MELHCAGENALMLYLGEETSPAVAARVQAAAAAIEPALGEHLIDMVPSYASILILYDPMATDHLSVGHRVQRHHADRGKQLGDRGVLGLEQTRDRQRAQLVE